MGAAMLRCGMFRDFVLCRNVGSHPPLLRLLRGKNEVTARMPRLIESLVWLIKNNTFRQQKSQPSKRLSRIGDFSQRSGRAWSIWAQTRADCVGDVLQSRTGRNELSDGLKVNEIVHHVLSRIHFTSDSLSVFGLERPELCSCSGRFWFR